MKFLKKSLGQNFLTDKNIVRKILNLTNLENKNVIEIGPGKGSLTDEILKRNPSSLILLEKDKNLFKFLKKKYSSNNIIRIINVDVLKFDFEIFKKKYILLGNLPYNISSQILIKILKSKKIRKFDDIIFMFQKELGEKIISQFPSSHYGRLSIITSLKLYLVQKFLVRPSCFFPRPKVNSMVIHFRVHKKDKFNIKNISSLEKVTNTLFSSKRKMINKSIKKLLYNDKLGKLEKLNLNLRPSEINPEMYYQIAKSYEDQ